MSLWKNTIWAKEKGLGKCLGLLCFLLRGVTLIILESLWLRALVSGWVCPTGRWHCCLPEGRRGRGRSSGGEERGWACSWIKVKQEERPTPHSCCSSNVLFPALCKPGLTCRQQKMSNNKRCH